MRDGAWIGRVARGVGALGLAAGLMAGCGGSDGDGGGDPMLDELAALDGAAEDPLAALFPEFTLTTAGGHTLLSGSLPDQAALHGVLGRIRDLGLTLIAVETSIGHRDSAQPPDETER